MLLTAALTAFALSNAADIQVPGANEVGPSIALWCRLPSDDGYSVRRATLIDGDFGAGEVALTAGHSLQSGMACELRSGDQRQRARIHTLGDGGRAVDDWAVIVSDERFSTDVDRFNLAIPGDQTFTARMIVNSALAPICDVYPAPERFDYDRDVSLHTCQSLPGRSGAALIGRYEGQDYLIGINLGRIYERNSGHPRPGFLRRIDEELAAAVLALQH